MEERLGEMRKEREKREDEKGSHCFFKSTSWSSSTKFGFFLAYRMDY